MNIGQRILECNNCHFNLSIWMSAFNDSALVQLNDYVEGLLHLGPNVITFRTLLHLRPNVITFRTLLHLGQLLHLGLQQHFRSGDFTEGHSTLGQTSALSISFRFLHILLVYS